MKPRRITILLAVLLALVGCSGSDGSTSGVSDGGASTTTTKEASSPATYPAENRTAFLTSCVDNARKTSNGNGTESQLQGACRCLLQRFEETYTFKEFTALEQDLIAGRASDRDSGRLLNWSTQCAAKSRSITGAESDGSKAD